MIYLPFYQTIKYLGLGLHPTSARSLVKSGTVIDGLIVHDKVANFFIARTESLRKVGWDVRLKRLDHADFFTWAKGVLITVFDKEFRVLHARTPFDDGYMRKRMDLDEDRAALMKKYYAKADGQDQNAQ